MKGLPLLVALATAMLVTSSEAADAWSLDSGSCDDYVIDRESDDEAVHKQLDAWLMGFLTAANSHAEMGQEVRVSSVESMAMWVENWCRENPMETTTSAMDAMIAERRSE